LVTGVLASALCFVPLKLLLIATGAGVAVIYSVLCIAALLGRASRRTDHAPFRMRGFPFAPIIALVALVGVIWSSWQDPMEGRTGLLIAIAVAVISA
ncbi:APC family permease, partial [Escherichia coli]